MQVSLKDLLQLSPALNTLVRDRLGQPSSPDPTEGVDLLSEEVMIAAAETINRHMPVISVTIGKNRVDDALIDGGFGVNVITEEERRRLGLPKLALASTFQPQDGQQHPSKAEGVATGCQDTHPWHSLHRNDGSAGQLDNQVGLPDAPRSTLASTCQGCTQLG